MVSSRTSQLQLKRPVREEVIQMFINKKKDNSDGNSDSDEDVVVMSDEDLYDQGQIDKLQRFTDFVL